MWLYTDQWAAGFFDGEGCVRVEWRLGKAGPIDLQVTQKPRGVLEELRKRFGGTIYEDARGIHRWRLRGAGAFPFLDAIRPWCFVKRTQIDLAYEYQSIIGNRDPRIGKKRIAIAKKIAALKKNSPSKSGKVR